MYLYKMFRRESKSTPPSCPIAYIPTLLDTNSWPIVFPSGYVTILYYSVDIPFLSATCSCIDVNTCMRTTGELMKIRISSYSESTTLHFFGEMRRGLGSDAVVSFASRIICDLITSRQTPTHGHHESRPVNKFENHPTRSERNRLHRREISHTTVLIRSCRHQDQGRCEKHTRKTVAKRLTSTQ